MKTLENPIARLLVALDQRDATGRADLMHMAAFETSRFYKPAEMTNNWDTHMVEIKAHNLFASGTDDEDAILHWVQAAQRWAGVLADVERAEALLASRQPVPCGQMQAACRTIIADSSNRNMLGRARAMLDVIGAAT